MPTTEHVFFSLLRAALTETVSPSVESGEELYALASKHDLAHIIAHALDRAQSLGDGDTAKSFKKAKYMAVYRYEQSRFVLDELSACLTEAKIPFIPLKGAVLRDHYPAAWMRTSCDLDILVHEGDLDRAVQALTETLGYQYESKGAHDVSLAASGGQHVELHYTISGENHAKGAARILANAWEYTCADGEYRLKLTDAVFYLYHIAHMVKHLENGGCGVRPFMDLWILQHRFEADKEGRQSLLEETGLATFEREAVALAEHWFSEAPLTETGRLLEAAVLRGGIYGTIDTWAAMQQGRHGRGFGYWWRVVFPPFKELKLRYLFLPKWPIAYPFCLCHRLFEKTIGNKRQQTSMRLRQATSVDKQESKAMAELLQRLNLREY